MREMSGDEGEKVVTANGANSLLDLWPLFLFLTGVIAAWSLLIIATTRWIVGRCLLNYDEKIADQNKALLELERDVLRLRGELPLNYVRKEDHIRYETIVNTKLDRLGDALDRIKESLNVR